MYNKLFQNKVTVTNDVTGEQNVDENALQGTTTPKDTLWSVVLEKAIDATKKTLVPLKTTTYDVQEAFNYIPPSAGQAKPNIQVMVVTDAGSVDHDGTHDHKSAMQSKIVSVPLTRYSRTFGISMFDAQKGFEKTATQTAAVVNKILQEITKDFATTVATTENSVTVAEVSPSTVAHTVSAAFGDYGDVESLVLNPQNYAELIPDNALSLKLESGAYGIGSIYKSSLPSGTEGILYNADAVACAFARPAWSELPNIEVVEFEVEGIPFRMKIEADGDTNIIYHTVDVLFGCAVANDRHIAKLVVSGS